MIPVKFHYNRINLKKKKNFHGYYGNGGNSENVQTLNAHLHIPMIIPVMFHYNRTQKQLLKKNKFPTVKTPTI